MTDKKYDVEGLGLPSTKKLEGYQKELNEIEAELAPALGYPYDEGYGWVVGDHTCVTLAMEARRKIKDLETELEYYKFQ